jgi:DNA-binding transcriptional MerR regulator
MLPKSKKKNHTIELPPIPPKRYFTIGEVAYLCGVKPHVLRYWEQVFQPLKPMKRRGNRRYYQETEVLLIRKIRTLLYEKGFTIEGARSQLNMPTESVEIAVPVSHETALSNNELISELEEVLELLKA